MDKARSYNFFKSEIKEWINNHFDKTASILDVGAGCGTYYDLLHDNYTNIDAIEIYEPNIIDYNLKDKYINVYNENIVGFEYNFYNLIIFGDIIEHLSIEDAQNVLKYACNKCNNLIVAVPYQHKQNANENEYETHIQDDLTSEIMKSRYPYLKVLYENELYGYYIKKENVNNSIKKQVKKGSDKIDILYVVGEGSSCSNLELKYSLRSIDMFGKNIKNVYVVGNCPDWLSDSVIKIPCEDFNKNTQEMYLKAQNIAKKVLYAIDNSDIGEEFLVSMDDHFYTKEVDFANYPYFVNRVPNKGFLPTCKTGLNKYLSFLVDCNEYLKENNLSTFYFTLHRNMHVSRTAVNECREMLETCFKNNIPFEFFVLINNYRFSNGEISPVFINDIKISSGSEWWKTSPEISNVFSTFNFWAGSGLNTLMSGNYSKKSKYEK